MDILQGIIKYVAMGLEGSGILIIAMGAVLSTAIAAHRYVKDGPGAAIYTAYRSQLSRAILLGLEFLVAADIIRTVAIEPTFTSVGILGAIVIIRTFLSFTLEVEVTGRWPWNHPTPQEGTALQQGGQ